MIYAIVHVDKQWGIGKGNDMMFALPKDMQFFRKTTLNNTVVMGGKTLRSFPGGKPLKDRKNIVISRGQVRDDCVIVRDYAQLKTELRNRKKGEDIYIIGGGEIYRELLAYIDYALVTKVDAVGGAEVFFPNLDTDENFVCVDEGEAVEDNGYTIRFTKYKNLKKRRL